MTRALLVGVSGVAAQVAVAPWLAVGGIVPDLLMPLVLGAGLRGGRERGATWGFWLGCALDLASPTPFGLSALTYCVAGWGAGELRSAYRELSVVARAASTAGLGMLARLCFLLVGELAGAGLLAGAHWWWFLAASGTTSLVLTPLAVRITDVTARRSESAAGPLG